MGIFGPRTAFLGLTGIDSTRNHEPGVSTIAGRPTSPWRRGRAAKTRDWGGVGLDPYCAVCLHGKYVPSEMGGKGKGVVVPITSSVPLSFIKS